MQSFLQTFVSVEDMLSNEQPSFTLHLSIGTSFITLGASLATLGRVPPAPWFCVVDIAVAESLSRRAYSRVNCAPDHVSAYQRS